MRPKVIVLLVAGLVSFVVGMLSQYFYPSHGSSPIDVWSLPVFAFLIFWWYRLDTMQRGYRRNPFLNVGVVGLAALALPYYFFRSRGIKGGIVATVALLGIFILSNILTFGGRYVTYIGLQSQ